MSRYVSGFCAICGRAFQARTAEKDRKAARFCSLQCSSVFNAAQRKRPLAERLWARVDFSDPDGCWPWMGYRDKKGYGEIGVGSREQGGIFTHRAAYEVTWGPIPPGLSVLHRCDNPPCCNPWHLFVGTQADNMRDAVSKGRIPAGERHVIHLHPELAPRGERHKSRTRPDSIHRGEMYSSAKLTEETVREARTRYAAGRDSYANLATEFGVGVMTIWKAINRKTWSHVP